MAVLTVSKVIMVTIVHRIQMIHMNHKQEQHRQLI